MLEFLYGTTLTKVEPFSESLCINKDFPKENYFEIEKPNGVKESYGFYYEGINVGAWINDKGQNYLDNLSKEERTIEFIGQEIISEIISSPHFNKKENRYEMESPHLCKSITLGIYGRTGLKLMEIGVEINCFLDRIERTQVCLIEEQHQVKYPILSN